jgi:dienelactone hydrolase
MPKRTRVVAGVLGLAMIVAGAGAVLLLPSPPLPAPTGPFGIGTRTYHWTDTSRPELLAADPDGLRELIAQVWYPAHPDAAAPRAPYLADAGPVMDTWAARFHVPRWVLGRIIRASGHAVEGVDVAPDGGRFPVLVFLSGLGGYRSSSTYQIEELASHGFVVVGLDQPGSAAVTQLPDGRRIPMRPKPEMDVLLEQSVAPSPSVPMRNGTVLPNGILPYLAADVRFTLDEMAALDASDPVLRGRLDTATAGVFGMSLGGYVGPEAALRDERIKAVWATDAAHAADVVRAGITQPLMIMTRHAASMRAERAKAGGWPEAAIEQTLRTQGQLYERTRGPAYYLDVDTMFHVNWTDAPLLSPLLELTGLTGPIAARRGHAVTNAYTVAFFGRYLRGLPAPLLDGPSPLFPEVEFRSHP